MKLLCSNRTRLLFAITVVFLLILVSACNHGGREKPEWLSKWLIEPTCPAPCWERITPEETTMAEAYDILQSRVEVIDLKLSRRYRSVEKEISWSFDGPLHSTGYIGSDFNGEMVSFILLDAKLSITLEEAIEIVGEPDRIYSSRCRGELFSTYCMSDIIYTNKGISLETVPKGELKNEFKVRITTSTKIYNIAFFPPGEDGYVRSLGSWLGPEITDYFVDWHGYKEYIVTP